MTIASKYVAINGVNIHYVEAGCYSQEQPTLIFLHGFPEYWQVWQAQLAYFSTSHHVIAPDLPGYNLSDKPNDTDFYRMPNLIAFIAKFIEIMSRKNKVIVIGHDWGGAIAWPLAAFHSQLIERLVILNAPHPSTFTREIIHNPLQRDKSRYIHELIADDAPVLLAKNNCQYLSDKIFAQLSTCQQNEEVRQGYLNAWQQPGAINAMMQYYRAMPQLAPLENTDKKSAGPITKITEMKIPTIRVEVPTLVLWGDKDQAFVVDTLNNINAYVPNCQIQRFKDASHWLQHEKSLEINQAIAKFIS